MPHIVHSFFSLYTLHHSFSFNIMHSLYLHTQEHWSYFIKMSSVCIPHRASCYNNVFLHKSPESVAKFSTAAAEMGDVRGGGRWHQRPMVVDSVSCRQLYLRSAYTFSRKESVPEKTRKCFGMVKKTVAVASGKKNWKSTVAGSRRKWRFPVVVKKLYGSAISTLFQRVLTCTASVEVVDHMH